jgi:hypothetical protein
MVVLVHERVCYLDKERKKLRLFVVSFCQLEFIEEDQSECQLIFGSQVFVQHRFEFVF